ncbi:helix-turn-helix domain-containing protein [Companilactobacillus suantsaicola]|nr:helix-turn-helix transcriptional regulator [Companilactobacillus suantsaicola]
MKLNQILRGKRKEFNLTQEQLAEKLFVSSKTISN